MTESFRCGDPEALIAFLYEDEDAGERGEAAAHIASCASCATEIAALQGTRAQLVTWRPPEAALGFRLDGATAGPPLEPPAPLAPDGRGAWWQRPLPAWAQAAAALLIFVTGLSVGSASSVTTGSPGPAAAPEAASAAEPATMAAPTTSAAERDAGALTTVSAADLEALEARLLTEIAAVRTVRAAAPAASGVDEDAMLRHVRALIEDSELRQRRDLTLLTAQVAQDLELQRRVDLAQVQRSLAEMQGATGAEVRQHRQAIHSLMNFADEVSLQLASQPR